METVQLPGRPAPWHLGQGYGHGERIFDVSFHPLNEDIVVTASEDTSVRMWKRAEGSTMYKQVRAYLGHGGEVLRAGWSSNGMLVASGSADRTVRLWAADLDEPSYTGRQLAVLDGHPEEVYHVELMDPGRPAPRHCERPHLGGGAGAGDAGSVPLPPFETHILAASCESLFVWSLQQGAVQQQADAPGTSGSTVTQEAIMAGAKPAYIFAVSRQPAGNLVAAACCDGAVRLWSLRASGQLDWAGQVDLPGSPMCTGCAFADDGWRLGVVTREGRLVELDVRTMELLTSCQLPSSPLTIAYLPRTAPAPAAAGGAQGSGAGAEAGAAAAAGGAETWLVACRDGAVYGYALDQQAGGPSCVLLAPTGRANTSQLAVGVARGGGAVALVGEPQDTAHLPRMRKAAPAAPSAPAGAPSTAPAAAASTTTSGSGGAGGGGADGAGRPTVVPPPRRRGAGAGRRVAGGLGAQDPLALFEQPGAEELADGVAGGLAAMSLRGGGGGGGAAGPAAAAAAAAASASPAGGAAAAGKEPPSKATAAAGGAGGKGDVDMEGEAEEEAEEEEAAKAAAAGGTGVMSQPADGAAVAAGKIRAPLLVYRAAWS
ncbi:hypothetical protein CHLRE_04g220300v5 [Chlamydomonas reinhardtii]|uniref:Uncharacterized protein n=1 Tax=Chlamydomonas reinhardtii TaxID=3055 RepID=A0A2K3DU75_CHLRE|nr:uncharacterized protein CHLRE_04g220300v5 [Chlamydomonas reinhardtii]PNW84083.1 hypothetical protein CHLRE_04g220300v5 [Chlamydomonas reinhardtii]